MYANPIRNALCQNYTTGALWKCTIFATNAIKPFLSVIIVLVSLDFSNDTSQDIGDDV